MEARCAMTAWWRHQMETVSAILALLREIHRSPMTSPHRGQWRGALMFFYMRPNKRLSKPSVIRGAIASIMTSLWWKMRYLSLNYIMTIHSIYWIMANVSDYILFYLHYNVLKLIFSEQTCNNHEFGSFYNNVYQLCLLKCHRWSLRITHCDVLTTHGGWYISPLTFHGKPPLYNHTYIIATTSTFDQFWRKYYSAWYCFWQYSTYK